jgi:hypothetical protein
VARPSLRRRRATPPLPLRGNRLTSKGYALFSPVYDTASSSWKRVAIIESDLPEPEQQQLTEALRSNLVVPPPARALRLRIELRDGVRLAVGRREACPPALRNPAEIRRMVAAIAARYRRQATGGVDRGRADFTRRPACAPRRRRPWP